MERSVRMTRFNIFNGAVVIASGHRWVREQTKACFKQAGCAKSFRCVGKNFSSALYTNLRYAGHDGRVASALPIRYCAEFCHTLRSQHTDQMAQLIFDIAGNSDSVTGFFAQQEVDNDCETGGRLAEVRYPSSPIVMRSPLVT